MNNFAVCICCHAGDYHLTKILCASIRHFCGQVPIFLIKDGDFSTSQVQQWGQIYEFNPAGVPEPLWRLRGWGIKKLYAFFQPNYERFLYLDADIVLLNDPFRLPFYSSDFYVDTCGIQGIEGPVPGIRFRGIFVRGSGPGGSALRTDGAGDGRPRVPPVPVCGGGHAGGGDLHHRQCPIHPPGPRPGAQVFVGGRRPKGRHGYQERHPPQSAPGIPSLSVQGTTVSRKILKRSLDETRSCQSVDLAESLVLL